MPRISRFVGLAYFFILISASVLAESPRSKDVPGNVNLQVLFEPVPVPLATESVWEFAPNENNPHRVSWALERRVEWVGLKVQERESAFRVRIDGLRALNRFHRRESELFFRSMDQFPCQKSNLFFSTKEGVEVAAKAASEYWAELLRGNTVKLRILLDQISEKDFQSAEKRAKQVFSAWLEGVETEWNENYRKRSSRSEWSYYREESRKRGLCEKGGSKKLERITWKDALEPLPEKVSMSEISNLEMRAPARRWNGGVSVRVSVEFNKRRIIGQFLLDSSIYDNLISPEWMKRQGVVPSIFFEKRTQVRKLKWKGKRFNARSVRPDRVLLSSHDIPISRFWLANTQVFKPPKSLSYCCDGVLGIDFLRKYVIEFQSGLTKDSKNISRLNFWKKASFRPTEDYHWVEVSINRDRQAVSSCRVTPDPLGKARSRFLQARWDLSSDIRFAIHQPWVSRGKRHHQKYQLSCGDLNLAPIVPLDFDSALTSQYPGATIGMGVIDRGRFILDIPHGRLWFKDEVSEMPISENQSGLRLEFKLRDGDRELRVKQIDKGEKGAPLRKMGLKRGHLVREINGISAVDLDLWEVEKMLSGLYGEVIQLKWDVKEKSKIAPLRVLGE